MNILREKMRPVHTRCRDWLIIGIGTYWPNKFKMKSHWLSNAVQIGASVNVTKAIYIGRSYLEDRSNRPLHENYKSFCTHFFNSIIRKK